MGKIFKEIRLFVVLIVVILLLFFLGNKYFIIDIKDIKNAQVTMSELNKVRIALEEYYQKTGEYPDLAILGPNERLSSLDFLNRDNKVISFKKIFGRSEFPYTPETKKFKKSNIIYSVTNFKEVNEKGGWNYDRNTGEIHANLPYNSFNQKIDWNKM